MFARIRPGRNSGVESARSKFANDTNQFPPGPAVQSIFAVECGPRRRQRQMLDVWGEARQQRRSVWFCDERNVGVARRRTQERQGEGQVTEAP